MLPPIFLWLDWHGTKFSMFQGTVASQSQHGLTIAVGTGAAMGYSACNTLAVSQGDAQAVMLLYFETAGVIIALVKVGKYLESVSKGKTSQAVKRLMGLQPKSAPSCTSDIHRNGVYSTLYPG